MKASVFRALITIAKAVVTAQQKVIENQLNIIEDQIRAQINKWVQEVVSGMWRGEGANKFVGVIESEVMSSLSQVTASIRTTNNNVTTAVTIMEDADNQVVSLVNNLADSIQRI